MPHCLLTASAAALLLLLGAVQASAQDEPITLADDPFEITDPNAAPPGAAELAVVGSYARARTGRVRDTGGLETELELGVAPRLSFRVGQAGAYGNLEVRRRLGFGSDATDAGTDDSGRRAFWGGSTRVGALYQLAEERGGLPAVALLGRARTIYGPGRTAYETDLNALFGKTFARPRGRPVGVSLNLGGVARIDPLPGERPNRYLVNASVGRAVAHDTALVATYAREQQERGQRDFSLVQVGVRHRLPGGRAVLGLAGGIGTNRDSPRFQLAFAVQWALGGDGP